MINAEKKKHFLISICVLRLNKQLQRVKELKYLTNK